MQLKKMLLLFVILIVVVVSIFTIGSNTVWTNRDWLWLVILISAINWVNINTRETVEKLREELRKSMNPLEQKISDLEWTINNQTKKIEG